MPTILEIQTDLIDGITTDLPWVYVNVEYLDTNNVRTPVKAINVTKTTTDTEITHDSQTGAEYMAFQNVMTFEPQVGDWVVEDNVRRRIVSVENVRVYWLMGTVAA